jgi:hypothetical protein
MVNPNFYELTLEYVGGFGNITQDLYYDITFFRSEGGAPPVIPTKTSDLINDGEDGIHPFITAQDIPDALIFTSPLVDTAGTITINQSGLSSDGYLSSIDWNTFNDKQDALLGTGFVKSTAGVISYDTNTYYLASNPDGFITSAALTGYVPYIGATQAVNLGAYNLTVNNISVGKGSSTGTGNTAVGGNALLNSTTGEYNSAFGSASSSSNTTGSSNTSIGAVSLQLNTTGSGNSAIGRNSLSKNTTGNSNTAVGTSSLNNNTTGAVNVAIGSDSLFNNTTGFYNSALGVSSLVGNITGNNNSAFGYEAGRYIADKATSATILNNSLMLGWRTSPLANNQTNQIVIGYDAIGAGSNTVTLGNTSIITTRLRGDVQGGSFVKDGGTSLQYLMADGSVSTGPSLTGYVPYTGATGNVNLGTHTLLAHDLVINHPSGSGVAASITKGGSGEALTVVKTSGSGNAASITGGTTLISELNLTTDLADAYIASAATWNAKENPLTFSSPLVRTVNTVSIPKASGGVDGYLSGIDWLVFNGKQDAITLTTTGTSGPATLIGATLNIPQYGGGGGSGVHAQKFIVSGQYINQYVVYSAAPQTSTVIANRLYCMPFFPNQTFTSQSLVINVTTLFAGGLAKVLIFSDLNGVPSSKLYESADFDCSTIGNKTASVTFTFTAGTTYWLGFIANNATNVFTHLLQASVYAFSTNQPFSAATNGYIASTYNSIPSTLGTINYQGGNIPMVSIRNS